MHFQAVFFTALISNTFSNEQEQHSNKTTMASFKSDSDEVLREEDSKS